MKIIVMTCGQQPSNKQITKAVKEALGKMSLKNIFSLPKFETVGTVNEHKKVV